MTIIVGNLVNTVQNAVMSDVSLTLRSKNGHFSVKQATFNVRGLLQWGATTNATWEITGISVGTDALLISATAKNAHELVSFSDSYLPAPSIAVHEAPIIPEFPTVPTFWALILVSVLLAVLYKSRYSSIK